MLKKGGKDWRMENLFISGTDGEYSTGLIQAKQL